jgi:hypothetical protein
MGLAPIEIHDDPRRELNKEIHLFESWSNNDMSGAVITVIAVVEGVHRKPQGTIADEVREWTAYWMAFYAPMFVSDTAAYMAKEFRISRTRDRGNKIPRLVAEAMFPRLADYYFRE